ncbi:substrate-specific activator of APC-dependent proteolysis [Boothiomyces sp. JEL0866]|nr:substrate-specific activator of APC-dependent proteolysis [Boothiomyces sp. JEL0866]
MNQCSSKRSNESFEDDDYLDKRIKFDEKLVNQTPRKKLSDRFQQTNLRFIPTPDPEIVARYNYISSVDRTPTKIKRKNQTDTDQSKKEVIVNETLPSASNLSDDDHTPKSLFSYTDFGTPTPKRTVHLSFSSSQLKLSSQKALQTPKKVTRFISKTPYKVLDAPELQDDFYLNLVDWSSNNMLGVGLGTCVYLWSASTSKVVKLCDLGPYDSITSGSHIAVGTNRGLIQLWDIVKMKKVRQFNGHKARVGSLAWNSNILSSGSRDRTIFHRDVRDSKDYISIMNGHRQEVCGLKWSPESSQLASGGNDNKLFIWDIRNSSPMLTFNQHIAAVKAIAWSPHTHGLLASGGGTADRNIKFWNTSTGALINSCDTGSQVCNLAWSKNSQELVSTHGYSQNQINVWKYSTMTQIATLTGHTYRVLYLAMSPDGQNIVTGAGDETLRFWQVFNKSKQRNNDQDDYQITIR